MVKSKNISGRMIPCIAIISLLFCYVIAMCYNVQVNRHDELLKKAQKKYITSKKTHGKRGEIFDKKGSLLVGNLPCFDVCADPSLTGDEKSCRTLAQFLSPIIEEPADELFQKLMYKERTVKKKDGTTAKVPNKFVMLRGLLDYEAGVSLKTQLKEQKCKSVFLVEKVKRFYPKKQLLSNILGITTVNKDEHVAIVGIEKYFHKQMISTRGTLSYERTRKGAPIAFGDVNDEKFKDGMNIYLTVDEAIQTIVEEELDKLYHSKFQPQACYAVMVDPWSGDIMAIAQRPTFDPNDRKNINPAAWRNRIAEDIFEPGSTMKPITVAGAIDAGVVTPNTVFNCGRAPWSYGGKRLNDSHYIGRATVADILKESSNIGTALIALSMGNDLVYKTLQSFGIGQRTGIPLKPESRGIFTHHKKWSKVQSTRVPIGQGVAVTSLQMVRAYSMLANGGRPVTLNLVDRITDPATGKEQKIERKLGKSVYKNSTTHQTMVDMMCRITAKGGTGAKAAVPGYYVAGKTGTAQKAVKGGYSKQFYISDFVGFAPAYKPRFVLMVVADSPNKKVGYYASTVAAPVFKAIAERTLQYMGIPRDFEPQNKKKTAGTKRKKILAVKN